MNKKDYNVIVITVTTQEEIEVHKNCNGVTVRNLGNTNVFINGIRLLPAPGIGLCGESVEFSGNEDEFYRGRIQISFGAGVTPSAEITQKFYVN